MSGPYKYRPLEPDSIRLIRLHSGQRGTPIRCEIFHAVLERCPRYEALSYTWGDHNFCKRILLDDHKALTVTTNCYHAMDRLRQLPRPGDKKSPPTKRSRVLWIDAICINQLDNGERSEQVRQMPRIYSGAWQVIVWLGVDHCQTTAALRSTSIPRWITGLPAVRDGDVPLEKVIRRKLETILQLSWYRRVWVQQEVNLARKVTVYYGNHVMSWRAFRSAILVAVDLQGMRGALPSLLTTSLFSETARPKDLYRPSGQEPKQSTSRFWNCWTVRASARQPLQVLHRMRGCRASDPRDHLFAARGMLWDPERISVDYDLEIDQAFLRFALGEVNATNTLDVFSYAQGSDKVASWVPDWSEHSKCDVITLEDMLLLQHRSDLLLLRLYRPALRIIFEEKPKPRLRLPIVVLEEIEWLSGAIFHSYTLETADCVESMCETPDEAFLHGLRQGASAYKMEPSGADRTPEVEEKTTLGFKGQWLPHIPLWLDLSQRLESGDTSRNLIDAVLLGDKRTKAAFEKFQLQDRTPGAAEPAGLTRALRRICRLARGRTVVRDAQGTLGLAPAEARIGDLLCIMPGAVTPFIIRQVEDPHSTSRAFTLVGECFVDGLMGMEPWKVDPNRPAIAILRDELADRGYKLDDSILY